MLLRRQHQPVGGQRPSRAHGLSSSSSRAASPRACPVSRLARTVSGARWFIAASQRLRLVAVRRPPDAPPASRDTTSPRRSASTGSAIARQRRFVANCRWRAAPARASRRQPGAQQSSPASPVPHHQRQPPPHPDPAVQHLAEQPPLRRRQAARVAQRRRHHLGRSPPVPRPPAAAPSRASLSSQPPSTTRAHAASSRARAQEVSRFVSVW